MHFPFIQRTNDIICRPSSKIIRHDERLSTFKKNCNNVSQKTWSLRRFIRWIAPHHHPLLKVLSNLASSNNEHSPREFDSYRELSGSDIFAEIQDLQSTCCSGPLRCMAFTSLNFYLNFYSVFKALGLGKRNGWTDQENKRLINPV